MQTIDGFSRARHARAISSVVLAAWLPWCDVAYAQPVDDVPPLEAPNVVQTVLQPLAMAQAIEKTLQRYPDQVAAQAALSEAQAMLEQAGKLPNPQLELLTGRVQPRVTDGLEGAKNTLGIAQPLVWPSAQSARVEQAKQSVQAAKASMDEVRADLTLQTRLAFIGVLRAQEMLRLTLEDQEQLQLMRDRIKARVNVGESPRYEAVKAEAEALAGLRQVENARSQLNVARALLAHLSGVMAPEASMLTAKLPPSIEMHTLRAAMMQSNPRYVRAKALVSAARAQVEEARAERVPAPTVRAQLERTPDSDSWQVGLSMPIPLFDQRQGVVAAAEARLDKVLAEGRTDLLKLELALEQGFNRFMGARAQLQAIEGGLLAESRDALRVAELAYRAGERSILDVLDARRALRAVQMDRIQSLYETYAALFELERLSSSALLQETP